jgi:membrane protease YdiL (CAAX protease family)
MRVLREANSTRLRATLRAVIPAIATLVLFLAGRSVLQRLFVSNGASLSTADALLVQLLLGGLYVAMIWLTLRLASVLDRQPYAAYGLAVDRDWIREFGVGVVLSAAGIGLSLWWGVVRGHRAIDRSVAVSGGDELLVAAVAFATFVPYFLLGNLYEELVYRGVMLRDFAAGLTARGLSPRWAVAVATLTSSLLFGAYHVPLRGNLVVAIDAAMVGLTFALAYLLTGELGLPLGIHFGRISLEFLDGFETLGFELPGILVFSRNTLAANLEVRLLELGTIALFVVVWVYWTDGEIGIAENIYELASDSNSNANADAETETDEEVTADLDGCER